MRIIRLTVAAAALAALNIGTSAYAADPAPAASQGGAASAPAPNPAPAPAQAAPGGKSAEKPAEKTDPVVARVAGKEIHLSDISEIAANLPEEYRNMPRQMLYPMLLDQAIDRQALILSARKQGLDKDPAVQRQMQRAADNALQNALITREVGPKVTEAAVRARFDSDIASKPGEEEVHARHILVASEDEAKKLIAELKGGADFAALAKAHSTDPAAQNGGDLGFFKKSDMLPEFSGVAFSLKPGEVADKPVQTRYGWHVIKVEERRTASPPTFEQARDELRQQMIQEGVQEAVKQARANLPVEKFNPDGSPQRATDTAEPPSPEAAPAPAKK
jgi:peptidyl-prolyl cis-trans isomerase C